jgi:HAD superfamily hydrolase (TIGR01509 family)
MLLDLDGTLLDSEPLWSAAARAHAERHGCVWTAADDAEIVGWSVPAIAALLRDRGVPDDPDQIATLLHDDVAARLAGRLPWRPGALDLLTLLRWAEIPCALVTMTYRSLAEVVAAAMPPGTLRAVVAGDDVHHPKPHPEAYLTAAEQLGVHPRRCLVIEDSRTGVTAALAAGMSVCAVDPDQDLPPLLSLHHRLMRVDGLVPLLEIVGSLLVRA